MLARFEDCDDRLLLGPLERDFVAHTNRPGLDGALEGAIPCSKTDLGACSGCRGLIFERIAEKTGTAFNRGTLFDVQGGDLYWIWET